jgi:hypothetical protein
MALNYQPITGPNAVRNLPAGTVVAKVTTDGTARKYEPDPEPADGTDASEIFPVVTMTTPPSGRPQDGPGVLLLSSGDSYDLDPTVAVTIVSATWGR